MFPTGNELGPSAPRYSQPHQHYCYNSLTPTMYNNQFPPLHPQQASPLAPQSSHYYSQDRPPGPIRTTPPTHTRLPPKTTTAATSDIEVSNDPNTLTPPHDWQSVNRTKRRELSHPNEDAAQASSVPLSNRFHLLNQQPHPNPGELTPPRPPPAPNPPPFSYTAFLTTKR